MNKIPPSADAPEAAVKRQPHKHAEVIKAWADGAVIECRSVYGKGWAVTNTPGWSLTVEYRVKPEEKSYAEVAADAYCVENSTSAGNWFASWDKKTKQSWCAGVEAALVEFCKRNGLNRSEMK